MLKKQNTNGYSDKKKSSSVEDSTLSNKKNTVPQKARFCSYRLPDNSTSSDNFRGRDKIKANKYSNVQAFKPSSTVQHGPIIFLPFSVVADYFNQPFMQAMVAEANLQHYNIIPILPDKLLEHTIKMRSLFLLNENNALPVTVESMKSDWLKQHGEGPLLKLKDLQGKKMFANAFVLAKKLRYFDEVKSDNHDCVVGQIKALYDIGALLSKAESPKITPQLKKLIPNCETLLENRLNQAKLVNIHKIINQAADGFFKSYIRKQPQLDIKKISSDKKFEGVGFCREYIFAELALMVNCFNFRQSEYKDVDFCMAYPISRNPQSGALFSSMLTIGKFLNVPDKMTLLDIVFQKVTPGKQRVSVKQDVRDLHKKVGEMQKVLPALGEVERLRETIRRQAEKQKVLSDEVSELRTFCDRLKDLVRPSSRKPSGKETFAEVSSYGTSAGRLFDGSRSDTERVPLSGVTPKDSSSSASNLFSSLFCCFYPKK